jgi:hypothetical protein
VLEKKLTIVERLSAQDRGETLNDSTGGVGEGTPLRLVEDVAQERRLGLKQARVDVTERLEDGRVGRSNDLLPDGDGLNRRQSRRIEQRARK